MYQLSKGGGVKEGGFPYPNTDVVKENQMLNCFYLCAR